jgi:xanthine/uracil/vitamin C permease (AzgA family)
MIRLSTKENSGKSFDFEEEKKKARNEVIRQLITFASIVAFIRVTPFVIEKIF